MRIPLDNRTERERDILTDHFVRNYHFAVGQKRYKEVKFDELDKKLRELKQTYPQLSQAMTIAEAATPATVIPSCSRRLSDHRRRGKSRTPSVLPAMVVKGSYPTRLDLAKWLVSKENPLTARVTVNWIWQEIFGRGIVKTADDFGTRGEKPISPELLDWLASQFINDSWSVKQLVRTIVTSATYRQSSAVRPDLQS